MASLLPMALLLTLVTIYSIEGASVQSLSSSASPGRTVPMHGGDSSAATADTHREPAVNDINDEHDAVGTMHGAEFINRLLQLSNGLHVRNKPETEVDETPVHGIMNGENRGNDGDSEGTLVSLRLLLRILAELSDIDAQTKPDSSENPQKRTCRFNLGGHCATEEAVNMANQWHFFNSHFSPGRRRRNAPRLVGDTLAASRELRHRATMK